MYRINICDVKCENSHVKQNSTLQACAIYGEKAKCLKEKKPNTIEVKTLAPWLPIQHSSGVCNLGKYMDISLVTNSPTMRENISHYKYN